VDKVWLHGGLGQEAVISCLVYGDPEPEVGIDIFQCTVQCTGNTNIQYLSQAECNDLSSIVVCLQRNLK
jgi:hypothetical protein